MTTTPTSRFRWTRSRFRCRRSRRPEDVTSLEWLWVGVTICQLGDCTCELTGMYNLYIYIYIHIYIYIYDPGPRSRSPPQWYGPLVPDLESFISMVFIAFWMQNLIFPWYLHHFGWRTSYFHGMYSILDAKPHISIPTYQHTYIDTYLHTFMPTCIHTYVPRYLHTYVPADLHTYIPADLHTYIPTYLHTYFHTYTAT